MQYSVSYCGGCENKCLDSIAACWRVGGHRGHQSVSVLTVDRGGMTTRVLRSYGSLLAAIGAGVLLGGGLVLLMRRWEVSVLHDIEELVRHLNLLRREVRLLRRSLDGRTSNSTVDRQGQSLAKSEPASSSSSEDDELFQEALEVNV